MMFALKKYVRFSEEKWFVLISKNGRHCDFHSRYIDEKCILIYALYMFGIKLCKLDSVNFLIVYASTCRR